MGCTARAPELISLLGKPLYAASSGTDAEQEAKLSEARSAHAESPNDPEKLVWVGRRLGYLSRMNDAIEKYSAGIAAHPRYAPLYRHRGHRYISLRKFDQAIADLEHATALIRGMPDRTEPDGLPNAKNIPLTTTAFNAWYHLALAHYLKGDFEAALPAVHKTMERSRRYDDNLVATTYWTYLTLRRLGRDDEAATLLDPILPEMDIIENHAYHRLLLLYKGLLPADEVLNPNDATPLELATLGYGVGAWHLCNGESDRAVEIFKRIVATDDWPAFGFIAAEAELARMRGSGDARK